jgi:peptidoglycan-associated lipoprotein
MQREDSVKKNIILSICVSVVVALTACSSKKKAEDTSGLAPEGNVQSAIDSTPMSFDPSGSDSGAIEGLKTVNFEYDKSNLTGQARKLIQGNVQWLKERSATNMQIEGHCDARGSIEYNLSLGERRAQAVKNYMVSLGIPSSRLSIISYGKEKLLSQGDAESDHSKNRRANFLPLNQ